MSKDKAYCSNNKCGYLRCERNPKHIKCHDMLCGFIELDGTEHCYKIINKVKDRKIILLEEDFNNTTKK